MSEFIDILQELYHVAAELCDLTPWEFLTSEDCLCMRLPNRELPVYCSVLGNSGYCYGVAVYHTEQAIRGLLMTREYDIPHLQQPKYREALLFYMGNREELSTKDRRIMKQLGLRFRGRNAWPYFRSVAVGGFPQELNRAEAELLLSVLRNLYMMLRALVEHKLTCRFDDGEMLFRRYDEKEELWQTAAVPEHYPSFSCPVMRLSDEVLLQRIRKFPIENTVWEVDPALTGMVIKDRKFPKPFIAAAVTLADHDSGVILDHSMITPKENPQVLCDMLLNQILTRQTRPQEIMVRDPFHKIMLSGLEQQLQFTLTQTIDLPAIDTFIESFVQAQTEEEPTWQN